MRRVFSLKIVSGNVTPLYSFILNFFTHRVMISLGYF